MKKNLNVIVAIVSFSLILVIGMITVINADADTNTELPTADIQSMIALRVVRDDEEMCILNSGAVYTAYKDCNLHGDRYEYVFDDAIKTYSYRLMAIRHGESYYEENHPFSDGARIVGDAMNYLTVVGYDECGEQIAQATFIVDTNWVDRAKDVLNVR